MRPPLIAVLVALLGLVFVIVRGVARTVMVTTGVAFTAVGAVWLLYGVSFNTSIAGLRLSWEHAPSRKEW